MGNWIWGCLWPWTVPVAKGDVVEELVDMIRLEGIYESDDTGPSTVDNALWKRRQQVALGLLDAAMRTGLALNMRLPSLETAYHEAYFGEQRRIRNGLRNPESHL